MTLGDRLKIILSERNIKQVEFATDLGISPNYVNQLVHGTKKNISETLAKLIEETYGFSAEWVLTEKGEKYSIPSLTTAKVEFMKRIRRMPDDEVIALLAFANSLNDIKKSFGIT